MKISNETKVAILAIAAIALGVWGYNFIRGKNMLSSSNIYYIEYDEVNQLNVSTPVVINGFEVGFVADLFLKPDDADIVIVKIDLRKEIRVPRDTRAVLKTTGFMGGQVISLEYEQPCAEDQCAPSGTYLRGTYMGMLDAMVGKDNLEEYTNVLKEQVSDLLDTLNRQFLGEEANGALAEGVRDLSATLRNLRRASDKLDDILVASSEDIKSSFSNVRTLTDTLGSSQAKIARIIDNTENISSQLAAADLKGTLEDIKTAVESLKRTLDSADRAVDGIAGVAQQLDQGEGTLGMLLKDDELYHRLDRISLEADSLLIDFQERPYRYVPFKSRKKVKKYDRKDAKEAEEQAEQDPSGSNS